MNSPAIFAIVAAVKEAYLSLEDPDFAFVGKAMEVQVYERLLDQLEQTFEILETTDEAEDVAFTYLVSSESQDLGLWLSMVGPYALIQRVEEDEVEILRAPYSDVEAEVLATLSEHHISLVPEEALRHLIRMELPEAVAGKVTLYQALFDNSQAVPWDQSAGTDDPNDSQPD
jgi:hypothetical protein